MDEKTLRTLEFDKILERLAGYTDFAASREKALALRPTTDLEEARQRQALTGEARRLLDTHSLTIGGARDVREQADRAARAAILDPLELLDVKSTLVAARNLARYFEKLTDQFPLLSDLASQLPQPPGLVDAITRAISDRGEILDTASPKLGAIRSEMKIAHDRLLSRLQRMIGDPKNVPYLQEPIVTQREGRFVIPLRSEFKGRIKAIVHDQSSSGATLFVEPLAVVELNNQYRELQLAERDEERRILAELSARVGQSAIEISVTVEVIAELDLVLAGAKYGYAIKASPVVLTAMRRGEGSLHPGSVIRLWDARHPLLDPQTVVPVDVELDPQTYALVITGPNTGGKTVSLKTVGLLALMAQSGLQIPAQSNSELSIFEAVYADIGDEQSIEQSLSTFSGHITNIIRILQQATPHSLVILDELGAGTDPQEGAALARAILGHLLGRGITTLVTTHHPELKAFAHARPGVINASVEFDLETLRPTYHLTIGLPGRSNALAIASRLGMPAEIITDARAELDPNEVRAESLLDEIHHQREIARQARAAAERSRVEAEALRIELARRLERLEDERRQVLEMARSEAQAQVEALQEEIGEVRRQLARARQPLDALASAEQKAADLEVQVDSPVERVEPDLGEVFSPAAAPAIPARPPRRPLHLGSKVYLKTLGTQGVVIALGEEDAEVQVGMMRVRARRSDLTTELPPEEEPVDPVERRKRRLQEAQKQAAEARPSLESQPAASPGVELDLRGQRVDEALDALDRYLDAAYLAGLPWVRIIHGKGTGRLREAIRQVLTEHSQVASFEKGAENEGGEGVTVARLKSG
jgi:DNA mismatch repair protein MutS2